MNADVEAEIEIEMAKGKSAAEIGRILYERHN
jgi:DNA-binding CsgD family transcriptional regulator